jgi:P-type E1-E2 ATPase
VLIKPGEKVPIDGIIVSGHSNFNESMLTGESRPVTKMVGQEAVHLKFGLEVDDAVVPMEFALVDGAIAIVEERNAFVVDLIWKMVSLSTGALPLLRTPKPLA